jgi:5-methylthioadenosine/S-adenosylhomocysteine deaminase
MKALIKNGIGFYPPAYEVKPIHILIEDGIITKLSEDEIDVAADVKVFNVGGNLVIPGLLDCHTHLSQSFGRGIYDNLHLTQWLNKMIYHFNLTDNEVYLATQLGCIEAIKSGTTTVAEMTTAEPYDKICIQAIADSGLRADVCSALGDFQEGENPPPESNADQVLEEMRNTYNKWQGACDGRITVRVSPVGLPACTEELMRGSRDLANELGVGIHTHCSEGETETANAYERFGVLGSDCQLVHCIWLTERDKQLIADYDCSVVTCPSTNTKITDGMPPMPGLFKLGVNIAIGCDGEASSGTYDMFQEARMVSLLGKVSSMDAVMFTAEQTFEMMTKNGLQSIGFDTRVGELKPGYKADITVIEYPSPHLIDERRLMSNLIYSATGGDVLSVFVEGEPLMWKRELTKIDEKVVVAKTLDAMRKATHLMP